MSGSFSTLDWVILIGSFLAGGYYILPLYEALDYSAEELLVINLKYTNIKRKYIVSAVFWLFLMVGMELLAMLVLDCPIELIILSSILAVSIYNSLFALHTNVYPILSRLKHTLRFIMDDEADIKRIATTQLVIDAALLVVGLIILQGT